MNELRPECIAVYFGRILGSSRNWRRGRIEELSLKKRKYLGPTSMDAELSVIMSNIAQVQKNSFCFDPFVGTGSLLLTCTLHGAFCFGTDIDIRVLRGRGSNENIMTNFDQVCLLFLLAVSLIFCFPIYSFVNFTVVQFTSTRTSAK